MSKPLIVDLHLDLAWDALYWNRDLTLTAEQVREQERREPPQVAPGHTCGTCTTTFPELRQGGVGVILSTIMSRVQTRSGRMKDGLRTQEQCIGMGRGHLAYYQAMARQGHLKPVHGWADLEEAIEAWKDPKPDTPIYHVLSMESADPIADPGDVEFWWDAGLRVVGPAHFGDNTYIHGTGTEGGLKAPAPALYRALREAGIILDITHMADQAVWESLEIWDGPICATHCSARALIKGQRHLTDDMIREVIRRGGVIGMVFCQSFIDPAIEWGSRPAIDGCGGKYGMDGFIPIIEHIGDLAGGTLENVAIGTDMDGGFGAEMTPKDVDTMADVANFANVLTDAGYRAEDVDGILSGNALRLFQRVWSS
jgi:membrane dipeptidase